jgi:uroporphyrinogen-III decarboxylase
VDFFYEVDQRAGMDLRKLRRRFPHLTLWGGINSQTLHVGSVEEVRVETLNALEAAQECTGIVVGCSNQIVAGTPPQNIEVMMETLSRPR